MPGSETVGWKCLVCGYVHRGSAPPDECPVCGAGPEDFEALALEAVEPAAAAAPADRAGRVVVIGAGIAGVAAVEAVREADRDAEILLVSSEPELPYYRINLTRYLAGEVDEAALTIHPEAWYQEQRIDLRLGEEVEHLSPEGHTLTLRGGGTEIFDKAILTVGASPFAPPIPGGDRQGVTSLRSLADARRILGAARPGQRCVCIGGGILGLEAAGALARRGMEVILLERSEWLMRRQLDQAGAALLETTVVRLGIAVRKSAGVAEIQGDQGVTGVRLEDGTLLPADLVLITAGVRSSVALARAAGLEVRQGVVVDDLLATSHPDVFAAGDVAEHSGVLYGTWDPARYQGSIAGRNAAGQRVEFGGMPRAHTVKVLGLPLFSIGRIEADAETTEIAGRTGERYARLLFEGGRLAGAILVGDTGAAAAVRNAVETGRDFSALLSRRPDVAEVLDRATDTH